MFPYSSTCIFRACEGPEPYDTGTCVRGSLGEDPGERGLPPKRHRGRPVALSLWERPETFSPLPSNAPGYDRAPTTSNTLVACRVTYQTASRITAKPARSRVLLLTAGCSPARTTKSPSPCSPRASRIPTTRTDSSVASAGLPPPSWPGTIEQGVPDRLPPFIIRAHRSATSPRGRGHGGGADRHAA